MKYGLLKYRDFETNIGDYTQSIAAKRFLPKVDILISREELNQTNEVVKIILNGWFMHHPENWPPSKYVQPRFVSFHINAFAEEHMTNEESIAYYKKHEPIGCRDLFTVKTLQDKGVNAYFSGCLTLTLEKEKFISNEPNSILFCDILTHKNDVKEQPRKSFFKTLRNPHKPLINAIKKSISDRKENKKRNALIQKLIPKNIIKSAIHISNQDYTITTHEEKYKASEKLLSKYASAKLVVTSRIHAALPCLAFGTPVVFIHPNRDNSRFEGLIDLFHTFTIDQIENTPKEKLQEQFLDASVKNKNLYLKYREQIILDFASKPL